MLGKAVIALLILPVIAASFALAQTPATGSVLRLIATSDNVSGAGETIKINLQNWSNDMDRDQLVAAWTLTTSAPARGGGARGGARGGAGGGAGARGGGARGGAGRGAANPPAPTAEPGDGGDAPDDSAVAAAPATGRGGGRGAGNGGGTAAAAPTPAGSLMTALQNAMPIGYLWTSENVGYSIRFAYRLPLPNGGERVILATDRRLGASNNRWKPAGTAAPNNYEFSVIELHLNAKHEGEGKASLTGDVAVDDAAKTIALGSYSSLPIVLKGVKEP